MLVRDGDRHLDIPGRPISVPQQLDAWGRETVRHLWPCQASTEGTGISGRLYSQRQLCWGHWRLRTERKFQVMLISLFLQRYDLSCWHEILTNGTPVFLFPLNTSNNKKIKVASSLIVEQTCRLYYFYKIRVKFIQNLP